MSMFYLCDLCGAKHYDSGTWVDWESGKEEPIVVCKAESKRPRVTGKFAIDYGRDDLKAICEHFEPKEGGDD